MLAELLKELKLIVSAAELPKTVQMNDPRVQMVSCNGVMTVQDIPAPLRNHTVDHIDDFIAAANRWGTAGVVFHSPAQIVLVVNDDDRRDLVGMKLVESDCFKFLRKVGNAGIDHKQFVAHLKTILFEKAPDGLLPIVRKLEASTATKVSSEFQQGRERGTKEFQAELVGSSELPELVPVMTSVYSNAGLRIAQRIRCTLDVELPQLLFKMAPLPDALNLAVEEAQLTIHGILKEGLEEGIDVFHGAP
jgi:hypothetical protein